MYCVGGGRIVRGVVCLEFRVVVLCWMGIGVVEFEVDVGFFILVLCGWGVIEDVGLCWV